MITQLLCIQVALHSGCYSRNYYQEFDRGSRGQLFVCIQQRNSRESLGYNNITVAVLSAPTPPASSTVIINSQTTTSDTPSSTDSNLLHQPHKLRQHHLQLLVLLTL